MTDACRDSDEDEKESSQSERVLAVSSSSQCAFSGSLHMVSRSEPHSTTLVSLILPEEEAYVALQGKLVWHCSSRRVSRALRVGSWRPNTVEIKSIMVLDEVIGCWKEG